MERCATKIAYPDWEVAERAALALMDDLRAGRLRVRKGGTVFAYRCGDHYHIGHQPLPKTAYLDGCIPAPYHLGGDKGWLGPSPLLSDNRFGALSSRA